MKKLTGYRRYRDSGKTVYDEDVYQLIKKHSRLIDRLNPRKMIEMFETASAMMDDAVLEPEQKDWMFYGRKAPKEGLAK